MQGKVKKILLHIYSAVLLFFGIVMVCFCWHGF